ncbi:MAG: tetratricopeptide repeat protein, partial [Thermodesulfobacteriota bacterium]|nr:tetratricopeptide repeat protein [Thermodesulfobacteriota bacterium]
FLILGFSLYSNSLDAPFVLDDEKRIKDNPHIRLTSLSFQGLKKAAMNEESSRSRPVGNVTFALNYYFHQSRFRGYHVVNTLIHVINTILIYALATMTLTLLGYGLKNSLSKKQYAGAGSGHPIGQHTSLNPSVIAFFAALLWLVNPLHIQSVTYIVQRQNSMATLFYLLSLLLYGQGRLIQRAGPVGSAPTKGEKAGRPSKAQGAQPINMGKPLPWVGFILFAGAALCWILALGCKQTAASLPVLVLLYEWYFFQDLRGDWLKGKLTYLLGIMILFLLVAMVFMGRNPWKMITSGYDIYPFTMGERIQTEWRVVVYYVSLLLFPHPSRLNLDYDYAISRSLVEPVSTVFSFLLIAGAICLALYLAKRDRFLSFSIFWFLGNLVIESSIIPLALIFEHRTYLPSIFLITVAVVVVFRYARFKWVAMTVLCLWTLVCAIWTYERNEVWRDELSLWKDCVEKSPGLARPHNNLGLALAKQGKNEEAIDHYREALRIDPDSEKAHNNLGLALESQGKVEEAIRHYVEALDIRPDYFVAHNNLGSALGSRGRFDEAIKHYQEALRIQPLYAKAHNNLGNALASLGKLEEALKHYAQAFRIKPDSADAHNNMGNALASLGKLEEALSHYHEALRIEPDFADAHFNLGNVWKRQGRPEEAIAHFKEALRIQPDYAKAHNNLGTLLARQGKLEEAIAHFTEALRIEPDFEEAKNNLGLATQLKDQGKGR